MHIRSFLLYLLLSFGNEAQKKVAAYFCICFIPSEWIEQYLSFPRFYHVVLPTHSFLLVAHLSVLRWASVSPVISTSYTGSTGSTSVGWARNRFLISIPSLANTAISNMAAHFVHSRGSSADARSQKGFMLSGFFENPGGCAMSYRQLLEVWTVCYWIRMDSKTDNTER